MRAHAWNRGARHVRDWNVLITVRGDRYTAVRRALRDLGRVGETGHFNVLVMRVEDPLGLLERLPDWYRDHPDLRTHIAHVVPVERTFVHGPEQDFEARAAEAVRPWIPALAGCRFLVRVHRRGLRYRDAEHVEERFLRRFLLRALEDAGTPGEIDHANPDAVLVVALIRRRAGLSLWTRAQLQAHPELGLVRVHERAPDETGARPTPARRA